jgi:hypothetical protein
MKKLIRAFPALLLAGSISVSTQPASAEDDPFAPGQGNGARERDNRPKFISVCFETFSVEMAEAAALYQGQPNDPALYNELTARVAKGKARQESFAVLRARSGEKALLKGVTEFIYPVSYLPVAKPDEKSADGSAPTGAAPASETTAAPANPALPLASGFKTRGVGFTLEIEPTMMVDSRMIALRIVPSFANLADRTKWGSTEYGMETPVFETQEAVVASNVLSGQPQLLSTLNRPPVSKVDADSAKRIWFAFVTATIVSVPADK